jgi:tryptophan synthase beta chain
MKMVRLLKHILLASPNYPAWDRNIRLKDIGRVSYVAAMTMKRKLFLLLWVEGIIPALESDHAVAYAMKLADDET